MDAENNTLRRVRWSSFAVSLLLLAVSIASAHWTASWGDGSTTTDGRVFAIRAGRISACRGPSHRGLAIERETRWSMQWGSYFHSDPDFIWTGSLPLAWLATACFAISGVACIPRWRRHRSATCPGCGYDVRGLRPTTHVCPECGEPRVRLASD